MGGMGSKHPRGGLIPLARPARVALSEEHIVMRAEALTSLRLRLAAFFVCFGLIVIHDASSTGAQSGNVIADPESYAVFAAALAIRSGEKSQPSERVALLEETRPVTTCPDEKAVPPEWRPVVANHKKENASIRALQPDADLGRPYSVVSIADLRALMRNAGYDLSKFSGQQSPGAQVFRSFLGGRLVAFSAVGFDEKKTRAMVTVQYDCFPTAENQPPNRYCHEYQQLMLEKHEGKWIAARGVGVCGGIA
jgi:hypothetical protein